MIEGSDKIGVLAAKLMEEIEAEDLPDGLYNGRVETVGLVVELRADGNDNEDGHTRVMYRCTDTREWVQAGLFLAVSDSARQWGERAEDDAED